MSFAKAMPCCIRSHRSVSYSGSGANRSSSSATSASRARCSRSGRRIRQARQRQARRTRRRSSCSARASSAATRRCCRSSSSARSTMALPSTVMCSEALVRHLRDALPRQGPRAHGAHREGVFWPKLAPAAEKKGLKLLAVWENGFRHITNNKRPIKPADLQASSCASREGKWRVKMFQAYGANPRPMKFSASCSPRCRPA